MRDFARISVKLFNNNMLQNPPEPKIVCKSGFGLCRRKITYQTNAVAIIEATEKQWL